MITPAQNPHPLPPEIRKKDGQWVGLIFLSLVLIGLVRFFYFRPTPSPTPRVQAAPLASTSNGGNNTIPVSPPTQQKPNNPNPADLRKQGMTKEGPMLSQPTNDQIQRVDGALDLRRVAVAGEWYQDKVINKAIDLRKTGVANGEYVSLSLIPRCVLDGSSIDLRNVGTKKQFK